MSNESEFVALWTETGLRRIVPRTLIQGIENMDSSPNITMRTSSIVVLDQLIEFLTTSKEPEFMRPREMLLLAVHYDLLELIGISAKALCREVTLSNRAVESLYHSLQHLHGDRKYDNELRSLWERISEFHPIYVEFRTVDGNSQMVPLGLVQQHFSKMNKLKKEGDYGKAIWPPQYVERMELFQAVLKYAEGELDIKCVERAHLPSLVEMACFLGYRALFCEALGSLKDIPPAMADDIYDLLEDSRDSEDYSVRMEEIQPYLAHTGWRSGLVIPLVPKRWEAGAKGDLQNLDCDLLDERIHFVKKSFIEDRLSTYKNKECEVQVVNKSIITSIWEKEDLERDLITLLAEDGTRYKVDKDTLIASSGFFSNFLEIFPMATEFSCSFCSDGMVLSAWINFMFWNSTFGKPRTTRHFVDLNRIADYYMVPGLLAHNLEHVHSFLLADPMMVYHSIPQDNYLDDADRVICQKTIRQIEWEHLDLVYDSPRLLNLAHEGFYKVLFTSQMNTNPNFVEKAVRLHFESNLDEFRSSHSKLNQVISELSSHTPFTVDSQNRSYLGSGSVVLLKTDLNRLNVNSFIYVFENNLFRKIEGEQFYVGTLGYLLKAGKTLFVLQSDDSIKVYDLNDGTLANLQLPESCDNEKVKLISWNEEIFAIGDNIWKYSSGAWVELDFEDYGYPLHGEPYPIGDRLYFFSADGDWPRYLIKRDTGEFATSFIEPTENTRIIGEYLKCEPILRFDLHFQGHDYCKCSRNDLFAGRHCSNQTFSGLISNPAIPDRYILFMESEVLVIVPDSWAIVENRPWPSLPRTTGLFNSAVFTNNNLHLLYHERYEREFVVYELDFSNWRFVKTLEDILQQDSTFMLEKPLGKYVKVPLFEHERINRTINDLKRRLNQ